MKHRWVSLIPFNVSEEEMLAYLSSGPNTPTTLKISAERMAKDLMKPMGPQGFSAEIGCFTCEQLAEVCHDKPCPGEPIGHASSGKPIYANQG